MISKEKTQKEKGQKCQISLKPKFFMNLYVVYLNGTFEVTKTWKMFGL